MQIWNLALKNLTTLMLWRTGEAEFRVIQAGEPLAMLTNADYILMDEKLKSLLNQVCGQVTYTSVEVHDNVRKLTLDNYVELKIMNEVTPDSINNEVSEGLRIWHFVNQHVFISDDLKKEIERMYKDEFEFSEGFSYFAGVGSL